MKLRRPWGEFGWLQLSTDQVEFKIVPRACVHNVMARTAAGWVGQVSLRRTDASALDVLVSPS